MPSQSRDRRASNSRALSTFERAQLLTSESSPFNLVVSLRVEGSLNKELLRRALDVLQLRHPMLAVRVAGTSSTAVLADGDVPSIPLRTFQRSHETSWIRAVETELSIGFDRAEGPLARCGLLESERTDGPNEIILTFHHIIVDATSAGRIVDDLLELCGAGAAASPTGDPRQELPPRADDLFPSRYRGVSRLWPSCRFLAREMAGEAAYRWHTRAHRSRPPRPEHGKPVRCRVLPIALSEAETDTLVRAIRRRRLTLNSALTAALLLAVVRRRYSGTDLPHRYFVFPTLRPHLDPPLPDDCDGSYLTTQRYTVRASDTRNVWDFATEIQMQVHRSEGRGEKFLAALHSAMSMKMVLGQSGYRMATIAMSYTGAYPFKLWHGGLELAEVHAFVSNLPVGPEYTAQARVFKGRLWLDVLYLNADMTEDEARHIAEDARDDLLRGDGAGKGSS